MASVEAHGVLDRSALLPSVRVGSDSGSQLEASAAGAARLAQTARSLAGALAKADRQRNALALRLRDEREIARTEQELLHCGLSPQSPASVARLLAARLGLPCAVLVEPGPVLAFDADGAPAKSSHLLDGRVRARREVARELAAIDCERPRILGPYPHLGIHCRQAVARIAAVEGDGLVMLAESGRALASGDLRLARIAAAVLAIELRGQRILDAADLQARESVVRDAIYASDSPASLRRRAELIQLDLDALNVVCLLADGSPGEERQSCGGRRIEAGQARRAAASVGLRLGGHLAATPAGVALISPLDPSRPRHAAIRAVRGELGRLAQALSRDGAAPIGVVSSACRAAAELPRALEECEALRASFAGRGARESGPTVLCADDLGAGKLLLGQISPAAAERFVEEIFGALDDDEPGRVRVLETLGAFFACNHCVRATAARLRIHENTVRYRFRKLADATGLDVLGSADDKLTARLALAMFKSGSNPQVTKDTHEDQPRP
ncbi:MAG: PucR family transcriptional regulator [Solirubrobacteraceae bacterium]